MASISIYCLTSRQYNYFVLFFYSCPKARCIIRYMIRVLCQCIGMDRARVTRSEAFVQSYEYIVNCQPQFFLFFFFSSGILHIFLLFPVSTLLWGSKMGSAVAKKIFSNMAILYMIGILESYFHLYRMYRLHIQSHRTNTMRDNYLCFHHQFIVTRTLMLNDVWEARIEQKIGELSTTFR